MMLEEIKPYTEHLNILYVEDEPDIRDYLIPILKQLFHNVIVAHDGLEGLETYEECHIDIDIVLTDISMPKMDGLEMSKEIKNRKKDQHIIVLSAHNDAEYLLEAIEVGVEYFILKPIQYDKMFDVFKKTAKRIMDEKELDKHRIDQMLEDAKKASTLLVNTIVNSNPFASVIIDEDLMVVSYNIEFFELLNGVDEELLISIRDKKVSLEDIFAKEDGFLFSDEMMNFKDKLLDFSDLEPNKVKIISKHDIICSVKIKQIDTDDMGRFYQLCFIEESEYK
jgi:YesN/AraC family two-component response regulator